MVYAYTQDVPIDEPTYRRIMAELGEDSLEGSLLHLCVRKPDGSLSYIDVWESKELCAQAFRERIHPAVDRAFVGQRPGTEPVVVPLDVIDATGALLSSAVN
jgi:hypothetical protein